MLDALASDLLLGMLRRGAGSAAGLSVAAECLVNSHTFRVIRPLRAGVAVCVAGMLRTRRWR